MFLENNLARQEISIRPYFRASCTIRCCSPLVSADICPVTIHSSLKYVRSWLPQDEMSFTKKLIASRSMVSRLLSGECILPIVVTSSATTTDVGRPFNTALLQNRSSLAEVFGTYPRAPVRRPLIEIVRAQTAREYMVYAAVFGCAQ